MRKYMKPVLEVSEDMTEGVYLASGNAQDEEKTTCRSEEQKQIRDRISARPVQYRAE